MGNELTDLLTVLPLDKLFIFFLAYFPLFFSFLRSILEQWNALPNSYNQTNLSSQKKVGEGVGRTSDWVGDRDVRKERLKVSRHSKLFFCGGGSAEFWPLPS